MDNYKKWEAKRVTKNGKDRKKKDQNPTTAQYKEKWNNSIQMNLGNNWIFWNKTCLMVFMKLRVLRICRNLQRKETEENRDNNRLLSINRLCELQKNKIMYLSIHLINMTSMLI